MGRPKLTALLSSALALVACGHPTAPPPASTQSALDAASATNAGSVVSAVPSSPNRDADAGLALLGGEWLMPLADDQGDLGYVTAPLGSTDKRPLVVALHGALDQPGSACAEWRGMFGPVPFIVCPAGARLNKREYVWGDPKAMRQTIERAVAAADALYPGRIEHAGATWASFSQSGMLSAQALANPGMPFRYAVLFEGVPKDLHPLRSAFHRAGIARALFANQQAGWSAQHEAAAKAVGPDIETRHALIGDGSWGHFLRAETIPRLHDELPWLTAGDAAWLGSRSGSGDGR